MFAHEGLGLIFIFIVFLLGAIAMFIHPFHALGSWFRKKKQERKSGQ
ncbi:MULTISPECIES: hypothetical protein [Pseudomonas syringae group]|nr:MULTISPECIES: hypothetical protein [Pseudomonas syringae group]EGH94367.1 hypothetical protein PLA106_00395 [Pseudomonas amygdali pv. lachrymans str. M302278]KPC08092.1 Uncharacterized protein AC500_0663 [Pseudomonas amygdali pv. lachrymans]KPW28417.1 hypothetical protein ALO87_01985 [Pseudomonas syringae pv. apii]KPW42666.1 hypothetical protein ALO88_04061 [Pseudomonas syringae pv. antirrhini]KTC02138.1 hypothetical protein AO386_11900 [Pseudomonas syringae ICMP 11292]POD68300.1 hypotheti